MEPPNPLAAIHFLLSFGPHPQPLSRDRERVAEGRVRVGYFSRTLCVLLTAVLAYESIASPYAQAREYGDFWKNRQLALAAPSLSEESLPVIVHIQDAHEIVGAQQNAASILERLREGFKNPSPSEGEGMGEGKTSVKLPPHPNLLPRRGEGRKGSVIVAIEGAWGPVETDSLASFPIPEIRKKVASQFLAQGKLFGEEACAITDDPGTWKIVGIENKDLYLANGQAKASVESAQSQVIPYIDSFKEDLRRLKARYYTPELRAFERRRRAFQEERIFLKEYLQYIESQWGNNKFPLPNRGEGRGNHGNGSPLGWPVEGVPGKGEGETFRAYPQLRLAWEISNLEDKLDPSQIEKERESLLKLAAAHLGKEDLVTLLKSALEFRMGRLSPPEFHLRLVSLADSFDFNAPSLRVYVRYLQLHEKLDTEDVLRELGRMEEKTQLSFCRPHPAFGHPLPRSGEGLRVRVEWLLRVDRWVELQEKAWKLELTPDEFSKYEKEKDRFNWVSLSTQLNKLTDGFGLPVNKPVLPSAAFSKRAEVERFYTLALQRNEALANNLMKLMSMEIPSPSEGEGQGEGKNAGGRNRSIVLIAGGFHTPGLTHLFRQKNQPYLVVRPNLKAQGEDGLVAQRTLGSSSAPLPHRGRGQGEGETGTFRAQPFLGQVDVPSPEQEEIAELELLASHEYPDEAGRKAVEAWKKLHFSSLRVDGSPQPSHLDVRKLAAKASYEAERPFDVAMMRPVTLAARAWSWLLLALGRIFTARASKSFLPEFEESEQSSDSQNDLSDRKDEHPSNQVNPELFKTDRKFRFKTIKRGFQPTSKLIKFGFFGHIHDGIAYSLSQLLRDFKALLAGLQIPVTFPRAVTPEGFEFSDFSHPVWRGWRKEKPDLMFMTGPPGEGKEQTPTPSAPSAGPPLPAAEILDVASHVNLERIFEDADQSEKLPKKKFPGVKRFDAGSIERIKGERWEHVTDEMPFLEDEKLGGVAVAPMGTLLIAELKEGQELTIVSPRHKNCSSIQIRAHKDTGAGPRDILIHAHISQEGVTIELFRQILDDFLGGCQDIEAVFSLDQRVAEKYEATLVNLARERNIRVETLPTRGPLAYALMTKRLSLVRYGRLENEKLITKKDHVTPWYALTGLATAAEPLVKSQTPPRRPGPGVEGLAVLIALFTAGWAGAGPAGWTPGLNGSLVFAGLALIGGVLIVRAARRGRLLRDQLQSASNGPSLSGDRGGFEQQPPPARRYKLEAMWPMLQSWFSSTDILAPLRGAFFHLILSLSQLADNLKPLFIASGGLALVGLGAYLHQPILAGWGLAFMVLAVLVRVFLRTPPLNPIISSISPQPVAGGPINPIENLTTVFMSTRRKPQVRGPHWAPDLQISGTTLWPTDQEMTEMVLGDIGGEIKDDDRILEIGTGSGILTRTLAGGLGNRKGLQFVATDINPDAVRDAGKNLNGLNIEIRLGSLFEPIHENERFNIIFWNPPWRSKPLLDKIHELALVDEGHQNLREFLEGARHRLVKDGKIFVIFPREISEILWDYAETLGLEITPHPNYDYVSDGRVISLYEFKPEPTPGPGRPTPSARAPSTPLRAGAPATEQKLGDATGQGEESRPGAIVYYILRLAGVNSQKAARWGWRFLAPEILFLAGVALWRLSPHEWPWTNLIHGTWNGASLWNDPVMLWILGLLALGNAVAYTLLVLKDHYARGKPLPDGFFLSLPAYFLLFALYLLPSLHPSFIIVAVAGHLAYDWDQLSGRRRFNGYALRGLEVVFWLGVVTVLFPFTVAACAELAVLWGLITIVIKASRWIARSTQTNSKGLGSAINPYTRLEEAFKKFALPSDLQRLTQEGRGSSILGQANKEKIYEEARRIFFRSGLPKMLRELGVERYVLHAVSGMAPGRVAIPGHSDLDLTLAVDVDSEEKLWQVMSQIKNIQGLQYLGEERISPLISLQRFQCPSNLSSLRVQDTIDIQVKPLVPIEGIHVDRAILTERLYDFGMPMAILLSNNFSPERERRTLETLLLGGSSYGHAPSVEDLIRELGSFWMESLAVDYYHLGLVGLNTPAVIPSEQKAVLESLQNRLEGQARRDSQAWQHFNEDLDQFHHEWERFLSGPQDEAVEHKFDWLTAHREIGNFAKICDRLLSIQSQINNQDVRRALIYYEDLKRNSGVSKNPVGVLIKKIEDNPTTNFGSLPGFPIHYLFTAPTNVIEEEFGMARGFVITSLIIDLLKSKDEIIMRWAVNGLHDPSVSILDHAKVNLPEILRENGVDPQEIKRIIYPGAGHDKSILHDLLSLLPNASEIILVDTRYSRKAEADSREQLQSYFMEFFGKEVRLIAQDYLDHDAMKNTMRPLPEGRTLVIDKFLGLAAELRSDEQFTKAIVRDTKEGDFVLSLPRPHPHAGLGKIARRIHEQVYIGQMEWSRFELWRIGRSGTSLEAGGASLTISAPNLSQRLELLDASVTKVKAYLSGLPPSTNVDILLHKIQRVSPYLSSMWSALTTWGEEDAQRTLMAASNSILGEIQGFKDSLGLLPESSNVLPQVDGIETQAKAILDSAVAELTDLLFSELVIFMKGEADAFEKASDSARQAVAKTREARETRERIAETIGVRNAALLEHVSRAITRVPPITEFGRIEQFAQVKKLLEQFEGQVMRLLSLTAEGSDPANLTRIHDLTVEMKTVAEQAAKLIEDLRRPPDPSQQTPNPSLTLPATQPPPTRPPESGGTGFTSLGLWILTGITALLLGMTGAGPLYSQAPTEGQRTEQKQELRDEVTLRSLFDQLSYQTPLGGTLPDGRMVILLRPSDPKGSLRVYVGRDPSALRLVATGRPQTRGEGAHLGELVIPLRPGGVTTYGGQALSELSEKELRDRAGLAGQAVQEPEKSGPRPPASEQERPEKPDAVTKPVSGFGWVGLAIVVGLAIFIALLIVAAIDFFLEKKKKDATGAGQSLNRPGPRESEAKRRKKATRVPSAVRRIDWHWVGTHGIASVIEKIVYSVPLIYVALGIVFGPRRGEPGYGQVADEALVVPLTLKDLSTRRGLWESFAHFDLFFPVVHQRRSWHQWLGMGLIYLGATGGCWLASHPISLGLIPTLFFMWLGGNVGHLLIYNPLARRFGWAPLTTKPRATSHRYPIISAFPATAFVDVMFNGKLVEIPAQGFEGKKPLNFRQFLEVMMRAGFVSSGPVERLMKPGAVLVRRRDGQSYQLCLRVGDKVQPGCKPLLLNRPLQHEDQIQIDAKFLKTLTQEAPVFRKVRPSERTSMAPYVLMETKEGILVRLPARPAWEALVQTQDSRAVGIFVPKRQIGRIVMVGAEDRLPGEGEPLENLAPVPSHDIQESPSVLKERASTLKSLLRLPRLSARLAGLEKASPLLAPLFNLRGKVAGDQERVRLRKVANYAVQKLHYLLKGICELLRIKTPEHILQDLGRRFPPLSPDEDEEQVRLREGQIVESLRELTGIQMDEAAAILQINFQTYQRVQSGDYPLSTAQKRDFAYFLCMNYFFPYEALKNLLGFKSQEEMLREFEDESKEFELADILFRLRDFAGRGQEEMAQVVRWRGKPLDRRTYESYEHGHQPQNFAILEQYADFYVTNYGFQPKDRLLKIFKRLYFEVKSPEVLLEEIKGKSLAQALRIVREGRGLTIKQAAAGSGFSFTMIHHWEVGENRPKPENLSGYAQYYVDQHGFSPHFGQILAQLVFKPPEVLIEEIKSMEFSQALKHVREGRQLTKAQITSATGIPGGTILGWEENKWGFIKQRNLARYVKYYIDYHGFPANFGEVLASRPGVSIRVRSATSRSSGSVSARQVHQGGDAGPSQVPLETTPNLPGQSFEDTVQELVSQWTHVDPSVSEPARLELLRLGNDDPGRLLEVLRGLSRKGGMVGAQLNGSEEGRYLIGMIEILARRKVAPGSSTGQGGRWPLLKRNVYDPIENWLTQRGHPKLGRVLGQAAAPALLESGSVALGALGAGFLHTFLTGSPLTLGPPVVMAWAALRLLWHLGHYPWRELEAHSFWKILRRFRQDAFNRYTLAVTLLSGFGLFGISYFDLSWASFVVWFLAANLLPHFFIDLSTANEERELPSELRAKFERDIWLWAFDKDDSLGRALRPIERKTSRLLERLVPLSIVAVLSGASLKTLDRHVTPYMSEDVLGNFYAYASGGGEGYLGKDRSQRVYDRPLSKLGDDLSRVDGVINQVLEQENLRQSTVWKTPFKRTVELETVSPERRRSIAEEIKSALPKELRGKVKVFPTSVAVEVSLADKAEALLDLAGRVAQRLGKSVDEVFKHACVVGDSEIDEPMLRLVAKKGGLAVWVGLGRTPAIDGLVVLPYGGPVATRAAMRAHLKWLKDSQKAQSQFSQPSGSWLPYPLWKLGLAWWGELLLSFAAWTALVHFFPGLHTVDPLINAAIVAAIFHFLHPVLRTLVAYLENKPNWKQEWKIVYDPFVLTISVGTFLAAWVVFAWGLQNPWTLRALYALTAGHLIVNLYRPPLSSLAHHGWAVVRDFGEAVGFSRDGWLGRAWRWMVNRLSRKTAPLSEEALGKLKGRRGALRAMATVVAMPLVAFRKWAVVRRPQDELTQQLAEHAQSIAIRGIPPSIQEVIGQMYREYRERHPPLVAPDQPAQPPDSPERPAARSVVVQHPQSVAAVDALPVIRRLIDSAHQKLAARGESKPVLIAVDGDKGVGKTYFSKYLADELKFAVIRVDPYVDQNAGPAAKDWSKLKEEIERVEKQRPAGILVDGYGVLGIEGKYGTLFDVRLKLEADQETRKINIQARSPIYYTDSDINKELLVVLNEAYRGLSIPQYDLVINNSQEHRPHLIDVGEGKISRVGQEPPGPGQPSGIPPHPALSLGGEREIGIGHPYGRGESIPQLSSLTNLPLPLGEGRGEGSGENVRGKIAQVMAALGFLAGLGGLVLMIVQTSEGVGMVLASLVGVVLPLWGTKVEKQLRFPRSRADLVSLWNQMTPRARASFWIGVLGLAWAAVPWLIQWMFTLPAAIAGQAAEGTPLYALALVGFWWSRPTLTPDPSPNIGEGGRRPGEGSLGVDEIIRQLWVFEKAAGSSNPTRELRDSRPPLFDLPSLISIEMDRNQTRWFDAEARLLEGLRHEYARAKASPEGLESVKWFFLVGNRRLEDMGDWDRKNEAKILLTHLMEKLGIPSEDVHQLLRQADFEDAAQSLDQIAIKLMNTYGMWRLRVITDPRRTTFRWQDFKQLFDTNGSILLDPVKPEPYERLLDTQIRVMEVQA